MSAKVVSVCAFYKSDQPGGFCHMVHGDDADQVWRIIADVANKGWEEETAKGTGEEHTRSLLEQLEAVAAGQALDGMTLEQSRLLMVANIYLLEKHGRIPSDEFNGILMQAQEGARTIIADGARLADTALTVLRKRAAGRQGH